jgi:DNA replication protein DnaC
MATLQEIRAMQPKEKLRHGRGGKQTGIQAAEELKKKMLQNSQRSTAGANSSANMLPQCSDCNDVGFVRFDLPEGHPQFGKLVRCACQSKNDMSRLQRLSGLTGVERAVRLVDIVAESGSGTRRMVDAAKQFIQDPTGFLIIHGTTGNAKTAALHGIVNELVEQSMQAVYITAFDLIGYIRAAFDKNHEIADGDAYDRLKRLEKVRVLCLDELDKVKWTDWVEEQITDLIDARYRLGLDWEVGTVIAMNASPDTLPVWIYSRLRDGRNVMVENRDADVRPGME